MDQITADRPILICANHANGFVDPVLLVATSPRPVRFLAKSTLWKVPALGPLLGLAGVLPVYRRQDGSTPATTPSPSPRATPNWPSTAPSASSPRARSTTRCCSPCAPVRRASPSAPGPGAGALIVPVGLLYEDKATPRDRVLVRARDPIDLDEAVRFLVALGTPEGPENHDAVHSLTALLAAGLAGAATDYGLGRRLGRDGSGDDEVRTTGVVGHDLRIRPAHATACAERLGERLFRREAGGQRLRGSCPPESVTCSFGVNNRSASVGVRRSESANRSTGTTSIPTPTITQVGDVRRRRARCVIGQVARERRHRRVQEGRGVVDRRWPPLRTRWRSANLAVVVDDVAGRVDTGHRGAHPRVDHDLPLAGDLDAPFQQRPEIGGEAERGDQLVARHSRGSSSP